MIKNKNIHNYLVFSKDAFYYNLVFLKLSGSVTIYVRGSSYEKAYRSETPGLEDRQTA